MNLSIAAASVIAFKPLVTRISPWLLRSDKASPESSESGTLVDETSPSQDSEEVQQLSFAEHAFLNKAISFTAMLEPSGDEKAVKRRRVSGTSLDFVDVQTLQPLTQLTMKESIKPLLNVAPLFFFCGLIYSFNDILNFEGQSQGKTADAFVLYIVTNMSRRIYHASDSGNQSRTLLRWILIHASDTGLLGSFPVWVEVLHHHGSLGNKYW